MKTNDDLILIFPLSFYFSVSSLHNASFMFFWLLLLYAHASILFNFHFKIKRDSWENLSA